MLLPMMGREDADLVREFMRVVRTWDGFALQVTMVVWVSPSYAELEWRTYRTWRRVPTPERLQAAQERALLSPRFFRACMMCGERNNRGHMHDARVCQGCAERHLGVVY